MAEHKSAVPRYILLCAVYAAECGLKALLMTERKVHSTEKLDEDLLTHDLNELCRQLNFGARYRLPTVKRERSTNVTIAPVAMHQALRYGAELVQDDVEKLQESLLQLLHEIKDRLSQRSW